MRTLLFCFALCNIPVLAFAQDTVEIDTCLKVESDAARLECYDRLHGYEIPEQAEVSGDGWVILTRTDEFTGKTLSWVYLEEAGKVGERDAAVLSVSCTEKGGYNVSFYKRTFVNTSGRIKVRYRFDSAEPISENWFGSTGNNGAFLPDNYRDFRKSLAEAQKLVLEVVDYQGARHRHTFAGLRKNKSDLEYVMSGCPSK
ncbi:hypothetical protein [Sulfitobacter mediterraneus]|uniref:DUF4360 domain-containing protein n=1 Tax=Sulfitobacter mediterraneus TaxID=83219 RepID=A0A2T6CHF0_9RHOB|nr:hypothetical protein [Sulfitobacter mediterraneus]PTX74932.1 hypothetical protein C8N31_10233 [Sulfitobacter mediterraneus]